MSSSKYKILTGFAQQTTAHGLLKLSQGRSWQRIFWMLVLLAALVGFGIHLAELVSRYLQYPVNTEFKESKEPTQFPSVTICPTNFLSVYSSDFVNSSWPRYEEDKYGVRQMIFDLPRAWHLFRNVTTTHELPMFPYSSYTAGRLSIRQLAYRNKQFLDSHEVVLHCTFNHRSCSYRNFTVYKDPMYFNCFTFTPHEREVVGSGEGTGLHLVLLSSSESSFLTEEEEVDYIGGFLAVTHDPGTRPDFTNSFQIPNKKKVTALLDVTRRTKLNRLPEPCKSNWSNVSYVVDWSRTDPEVQMFLGSKQECVIRERQGEFIDECQCFADHIHVPSDLFPGVTACHSLHERLFYKKMYMSGIPADINGVKTYVGVTYRIYSESGYMTNLDDYIFRENAILFNGTQDRVQCFDRVNERQKISGTKKNQCMQECATNVYLVTTTNVDWPTNLDKAKVSVTKFLNDLLKKMKSDGLESRVIQDNKTLVTEKVGTNVAVLNLFLRSPHSTSMTEDWAYPIRNLFSDFGGILGLWIGVSVITVVEFLELATKIIYILAISIGMPKKNSGKGLKESQKGNYEKPQIATHDFQSSRL